MSKGKILAFLAVAVIGLSIFAAVQFQTSQASYSGLDELISVTDRRFFRNPTGSYPGNEWRWGAPGFETDNAKSYDYHKEEVAKHQQVVIFYRTNDYYMTASLGEDYTKYGGVMSNSVVHCPAGATVDGPHNPHLFNSPSLDGMYDGRSHYWCSQNGVGVNPLPGPEQGKYMPDLHQKAWLSKNTSDGQDYYKLAGASSWPAALQTLSTTNNGTVKCKYAMSGPFGSDNHYHCLTQDGSREADLNAGGEDILLSATPPPVYISSWGVATYAGTVEVAAGAKAVTTMKLMNMGNSNVTYTLACTPVGGELKMLQPEVAVLPSPSVSIDAGKEAIFGYTVDVSTMTPGTQFVTTCTATRQNSTDVKTITDTVSLSSPPSSGTGPKFTVTSVGTNKYNILVEDQDGIKEYAVKTASGVSLYSATPGAAGKPSACGTSSVFKSNLFGTLTIANADFPLQAWVSDCKGNGGSSSIISIPMPASTGGETGATTCTLTLNGHVGSYSTNEMVNYTYTCNKAAAVTVQVVKPDGSATTYNTGTNVTTNSMGFSTSNLPVGSYTLRICINDATCPVTAVVSLPFYVKGTTDTGTTPKVCPPGEKCVKGSWCNNGAMCYYPDSQIACVAWPTSAAGTAGSTPAPQISCPTGTSMCNPTEKNCKQKGDSWTDVNSSYYCMSAQKCSLSNGGGSCVGWNEACPTGTKYCGVNDTNCLEPDTYKTLDTTSSANSSYWCGGGGGMPFYSSGKIYCPAKSTGTTGMRTGAEIKALLEKLGSGWNLCRPGDANCIEPGKTGAANGWCAWYPPNYMGNAAMNNASSPRTCPSLDETTLPPTPPTPIVPDDHSGCDMKLYKLNEKNQYVDEQGAFGPATKPGYNFYKQFSDHWHICTGTAPDKEVCGMAITYAINPETQECQKFSTTCIPKTWTRVDSCDRTGPNPVIPPEPGEPRECGPNEMPNYNNMCMMPRYRWSIAGKFFEKCEKPNNNPATSFYIDIKNTPGAKYTNCESMNYEIEKEWRTKRYLARSPEKYGEWYMPPWDAASKQAQYNPKTDQFEQCDARMPAIATMSPLPGQPMPYYAPCMTITDTDKEWLLEKARAEYKMHELYAANYKQPIERMPKYPTDPVIGIPELPVIPLPPIPVIGIKECKPYLAGIRQSLNGDKFFWKDVNRNLEASPTYADAQTVQDALHGARELIADLDKLVRINKCDLETIALITEKQTKLHTEFFPDLSSHLPALQDAARAGQCIAQLSEREKKLHELMVRQKGAERDETVTLIGEFEEKLKEFDTHSAEFDYDLFYECTDFTREIEPKVTTLIRSGDRELNRIIDTVLEKKFEPMIAALQKQLEERGKKVDELLVKVAELHKTLDTVTDKATQISEKITVSYTALARINEEFAQQKAEIQSTKDRVLPLVEQAMSIMNEMSCVKTADREVMIQKLGETAAVNWFGDKATEIERRLSFFIASCKARDVASDTATTFARTIEEAAHENADISYREGLTFDPTVPTHEWYYGAYQAAHDRGYVSQGRPGENALAQDALLMVLRAAGEENVSGDCRLSARGVRTISPYAVCAANRAAEKGVALLPDMTQPVSRVQVAQWLTQLLGLRGAIDEGEGIDLGRYIDLNLNEAQRKAVQAVVDGGLMVGDSPDGTTWYFRPQITLSRAALVVVLEQLGNRSENMH